MSRKEVKVIYVGMVQGVGFRWTSKNIAYGYEVVGYVRNLSDGTVELLAQGEEEELKEFIQAIRDSGLGPLIRSEEIKWRKISVENSSCEHEKCYKGFNIA